jgi:hypothetical protein
MKISLLSFPPQCIDLPNMQVDTRSSSEGLRSVPLPPACITQFQFVFSTHFNNLSRQYEPSRTHIQIVCLWCHQFGLVCGCNVHSQLDIARAITLPSGCHQHSVIFAYATPGWLGYQNQFSRDIGKSKPLEPWTLLAVNIHATRSVDCNT